MSTRSRIGVQDADGTIRSIYCHFDGYLDGVGATLAGHYADANKVEQLVALGDLSSLDDDLAPAEGVAHNWDKPAPGVTTAYHRDRGEQHRIATHETEADYLAFAKESWGEYIYLFRDGRWLVHAYPGEEYGNGGFQPIADAIAAEEARSAEEDA